ncbi:MAG: hypothetical protein EPO23_11565 [Xanthobacteraceae bacterium]|nr:MAG: hypothetical protein EPO23_11565 [Xanthobacteraceae bacterium]
MLPPADSVTAPSDGEADSSAADNGRLSPAVRAVDRRRFLSGRWLKPRQPAPASLASVAFAEAPVRIAVRARPERLADALALIATIEGAAIHSSDPRGLMVVAAPQARADAVLLALNHMPHVLSAAMVTATEDLSA